MIDGIDQHRNAQRIGQQDELLPRCTAHLTGAGQEVDGMLPFGLCRLDITHEIVKMADQAFADFFNPRRSGLPHAIDGGIRDIMFVEVAHRQSSLRMR